MDFQVTSKEMSTPPSHVEQATLGGGCFWCTEAIYLGIKGVVKVVSGYSGGKLKNPTYREVCSGLTGHAEVIQVTYDPAQVSYADILEIFWNTHDPTTLNRQGADEGTQYRSVVFYQNEEQKKIAEQYLQQLDASGKYPGKLVTEISPLGNFYPAEEYHQNYFNQNQGQGYCQFVIRPKVEKFRKQYHEKLI
jgi:peptide-methionine (S)-S-oxide reductase